MTCSALQGNGIAEVWETIREYADAAKSAGRFEQARAEQNLSWMRQLIDELLRASLSRHPAVKAALPEIEAAVTAAQQTPLAAAQTLLALSRQ